MTLCPDCGTPYMQVDVDHEWPACNCHTDPTCRHCEGTGKEWCIEENPETGEWVRVLRTCRCKDGLPWWAVVAILALLLGLLPSVWVGVSQ